MVVRNPATVTDGKRVLTDNLYQCMIQKNMLTIRLDSPTPLVEQVRLGIRRAIAGGEMVPGDPLPTVRQLAGDLGINFNTVARAYRDLEKEGLVATVRRRGTIVASANEKPREPEPALMDRLAAKACEFFTDARLAGLSESDVERVIQKEFRSVWTKEAPSE